MLCQTAFSAYLAQPVCYVNYQCAKMTYFCSLAQMKNAIS